MKQEAIEYMNSLNDILSSTTSIKLHVDRVYDLRMAMDEHLTNEERMSISNLIKTKVQQEALLAFNGFGAAYMATGSGKSKIAIDIVYQKFLRNDVSKILLVVPTEKLRDENWKEEFYKWGYSVQWHHIERTCYASLNKYEGQKWDFVILDEGHNITENNAEFFKNNQVESCLLLTATKPRDVIKKEILRDLKIAPFFELSLDESVKLGLVAPYDITIVTMKLDTVDKYITAGSKAKPFKNTEKSQYNYLCTRLSAAPNKMGFIDRMRFVYNLRSKTTAAKMLLTHIVPQDLRTLIFCGSKEQAIELCDRRFFSRPTLKKIEDVPTPAKQAKYQEQSAKYAYILSNWEDDAGLNDFKAEKINRLSCVNALNEGHNISNMDVGFVVQLNSNELHLIQRVGRLIRFRPGHIGKIIILCCEDTVDKSWVEEATKNLNVSQIEIIDLALLKMGIQQISFN